MNSDGEGVFITFEGGEGVGKSTQAALLASRLESRGRTVVKTREPGGTPGAEEIRGLLVRSTPYEWPVTSETLLMYAGRQDHLDRVIRPALRDGAIVICDRFSDSTRAYQGAARGQDTSVIEQLDRLVVGETQPDVTFILDMPAREGLARAMARAEAAGTSIDGFERLPIEVHERLRAGFLAAAAEYPHRCRVIDATQPVETVEQAIWAALLDKIPAFRALSGQV